jgi:hypothetical protein
MLDTSVNLAIEKYTPAYSRLLAEFVNVTPSPASWNCWQYFVLAWGEQAPYHDNALQKFQLRLVKPGCRTRGER